MTIPTTRFRIGKRVFLRAIEESDLPRITLWMNDTDTTRYLATGRFPLTLRQEREWLEQHSGTQHDVLFAICRTDDDQHIGNCGLHDINWTDRGCVLGIVLGDTLDRGQGYGQEVMELLVRYAFLELNLERIELVYIADNRRAEKLYRKIGFVEEGRLRRKRYRDGQYVDEVIMSLLRSEWSPARGAT